MPISVAAVREKTDVCTAEYEGETITLTYRSGATAALSPDERAHWEAQIARLQAGAPIGETQALMAEMIVKFVARWDVLEDDGVTMYPVMLESVRVLDPVFLAAVVGAVMQDFAQKKTSATPASGRSDATSSATARSTSSAGASSRQRSMSASPRAGKASHPGS